MRLHSDHGTLRLRQNDTTLDVNDAFVMRRFFIFLCVENVSGECLLDTSKVTLEMVYGEVKKVSEKLAFIEDVIEEVFIRTIPEESLPKKKLEEIKRHVAEMKKRDN